jgi:hypothetical protein
VSLRELALERASICQDCDRLFKPTWTCKECGCFMKAKVFVPFAKCNLGKWEAVKDEEVA